uniref:Uncharacterized protein n=1 Tax=Coccidioides posadasii RMSCC 3488 TaxID=454284 RepID=A0A0J6F407_COCPO|nr:hypothetical protein CPAG_01245 [Coccidioides posadasii RMSCC 3488]
MAEQQKLQIAYDMTSHHALGWRFLHVQKRLGLAFVLTRRKKDIGTDVTVVCDLWDRAKGEQIVINNITYQRSLRDTGKFQEFLPDYTELLAILSNRYGITHRIRLEEEFLKSDGVGGIIREIVVASSDA